MIAGVFSEGLPPNKSLQMDKDKLARHVLTHMACQLVFAAERWCWASHSKASCVRCHL